MNSDFTAKTEHLVSEIDRMLLKQNNFALSRWEKSHYKAIKNWLIIYEASSNNPSKLKKVKGYIEALYHLGKVEDWNRIEQILSIKISEYEFHVQLGIWGLFKQQISIYSNFLGKLGHKWDYQFLKGLGNAYDVLGNHEQASIYRQQWMQLAHEMGDKQEEGKAVCNLGISLDLIPGDLILATLDTDFSNLKSIKHRLKRTHYRASFNWITKYRNRNNIDASDIEKVKGMLEAIYHFCEVEAWSEAKRILLIRIDTPTNEELHEQLQTWGYYSQTMNLYERLLGKLDSQWQAINITGIGKINNTFGNFERAISCFKEGIKIVKLIGDERIEENILCNLGEVYRFIDKNSDALDTQLESLSIAQRIGYKVREGIAMSNLGSTYSNIQDWKNASYYLQKGFDITHSTDNKLGQLTALEGLGSFYLQKHDYDRSVKYFQKQLNLAREIGYLKSEAVSLRNLAEAQKHFIEPSKTSQNLILALSIFREIGDSYNEAYCCYQIAQNYYKDGDLEKAKLLAEKALRLSEHINAPFKQECISMLSQINN